ncbi:MAG TPA: septum formation initiator family protein [Pyrinomonadaceae bacterium]|nr:septum formation initiator family protein [Pyrinomonadaceae bacterium]
MNKAANTYWVDARLAAQRPLQRSSVALDANVVINPNAGDRARQSSTPRVSLFSPYAVFGMVLLAMLALCFSVTMRTHAEVRSAARHYSEVNAEVESLRQTNAALANEVNRLQKDPRAIEAAARVRLGMVRPNEIVVAVD